MNGHSKVIIVGRMNVGKSTLFNQLSTRVKSITMDYEGVTRDFLADLVSWKDSNFELVDSGGIVLHKTADPILKAVREQVLSLIQESSAIIFVVDGSVGLVQEDRDIAKILHKMGKPVVVAINKMDRKDAQERSYEFERLGFDTIIGISAQHKQGLDLILDQLAQWLEGKKQAKKERAAFNVVLLGKPNVGKSSLMNLLLKKERSLVSPQAGTTRESLSENVAFYQETIQVTDTPGVRRQRAVQENLEQMMVKSSLQSVRNADIVLLLIDASQGTLSDQELKLAFFVFEQEKKSLIILFNKQDLVTEQSTEQLESDASLYQHLLNKVEILNISCLTGKNVGRIMPLAQQVWERANTEFSTTDLTLLFKQELERRPIYRNSMMLKCYKAEQTGKAPITIALQVNYPKFFGESQLAYCDNILRRHANLKGTPIKLIVKEHGE